MASATPGEHHTYWSDLMVIGSGMVAVAGGISARTTWLCLAGLGLGVVGFAALRRYRWAALGYFVAGLALLLGFSLKIHRVGFSADAGVGLAASLACIGLSLVQLRRRIRKPLHRKQPPMSLILMQRSHRSLDDRVLAAVASSAWGAEFSPPESGSAEYLGGESPSVLLKLSDGGFLVRSIARKFWDKPNDVAAQLSDVRAQRVVNEHQSWLSVQFVGASAESARMRIYQRIGRLLAELAGPETLAILRPDTGAFHVWEDSLLDVLRSESPLDCFNMPNTAPVVQVAPDDPLMALAVAEAKRRWPEFVQAFSKRHPEQHFSVKAPVTREGQTEHIWIDVTSLSGEYVRGKLGNDPVDLHGMKLGDPISVPVSSLEDWLYVLTDTPVGGFTIPAVTSAPWRTQRT